VHLHHVLGTDRDIGSACCAGIPFPGAAAMLGAHSSLPTAT
jgi:hypothetical protein